METLRRVALDGMGLARARVTDTMQPCVLKRHAAPDPRRHLLEHSKRLSEQPPSTHNTHTAAQKRKTEKR
jgi:hypothetical protein